MTDFSKILIRASACGYIMTEPKEVELKKINALSKTAKIYLKKIYKEIRWGRKTDLQTRYTDKGKLVEEDSITLISLLDKKFYKKNTERLSNDFFTGEPDIYEGEEIRLAIKGIDTKSSWDADTFLANIGEKLDSLYEWQAQIYMDLTGALEWEISFCLVDTPIHLVEAEKRKLLYQMNVVTEEDLTYKAACKELEYNMFFSNIPAKERRYKYNVKKNESAIEKARNKVIKSREWLSFFENLHINQP